MTQKAKPKGVRPFYAFSGSDPFRFGFYLLFLSVPFCFAADEQEANLPRDQEGVIVSDIQHLDIPEDRKVLQVASNVIRPENDDQFISRRFSSFEQRVKELESRLSAAEKEIIELDAIVKKMKAKESETVILSEAKDL